MIVDTSAVMAILNDEPLAERLIMAIATAASRSMSAVSWIELQAVSTRRYRGELDSRIERLRQELSITIVPVSLDQAELGRQAYRIYGRGVDPRAKLNLGDCFAYALASATGEPLLFVGDDFVHTDLVSAL